MRERKGVRIRIFGPLEARLQTIDRMVLGGLNEGELAAGDAQRSLAVAPDAARARPRSAGAARRPAAHDFAQALGAKEVVLTRAAKSRAARPTVASRFLQRSRRWPAPNAGPRRAGAATVISRSREALDAPAGKPHPVKRPEPSPPLEARPDRLSVTEIENWLRDPYTIYAKHVLDLHPLEAVDTPPGAADRGSVIHEAIGDFTRQFAAGLPADPEQELIALGEQSFAHAGGLSRRRKAFWWPRFLRIARWFAGWERERRPQLAAVHGEIRGELKIPLGARVFTLSARADRIERRADGRYAILDYKTGAPPTEPQVRTGLAPQLTLEAAILRGGGFADKGIARRVGRRDQLCAAQGRRAAGELKPIDFKDEATPDSSRRHRARRS